MYVFYENYKPKAEALALLDKIITIVQDYSSQGLRLTLRQLYYQLVSKDLIPNKKEEYDRVGNIVSRARLGGQLDWDAIEDRVRRPERPPEFDSLDDLVEAAFASFRLPRLKGQKRYVELWVEKDALAGVLAPIAHRYHITMMVNRGYSSTSAMRESGLRVREQCKAIDVDEAVILYLGDLDPSGEDMVRDIDERLNQFVNGGLICEFSAGRPYRGGDVNVESTDDHLLRLSPRIDVLVRKIALTPQQVEEFDPPPNPAKVTDSRAAKYIEEHGTSSWEVDALPPPDLRDIIEGKLELLLDMDLMDKVKEQENDEKKRLRTALANLERKPKKKKK